MRLAQFNARDHAHAFLDGVLPEPDQDYSALPPECRAAYEAGLALRGRHPRAECREPVGDDGVQRYEVHDDSAASGTPSPRAMEETLAARERYLLEQRERDLADQVRRLEAEARIRALEEKIAAMRPPETVTTREP